MAALDANDSVSYERTGPALLTMTTSTPPAPPRFAFVRTPAWGDADPALHAAFAPLVAALGARVAEVDIGVLAEVIEWQRIVQLLENAYYYGPLMKSAPELLSDGLKARLEAGLAVEPPAYAAALAACEPAYRTVAAVLDDYDAILTPAATGPAPHGLGSTGSPVFNGLWNYLGMPAVSLPLLEAGGLPIGVQLVGKRRDDGALLRTARWLEAELLPQV
jgi:Asp-tRNA(Asn)/Glu-tRNA(Gln) amidotransferase A subunit family amidase